MFFILAIQDILHLSLRYRILKQTANDYNN